MDLWALLLLSEGEDDDREREMARRRCARHRLKLRGELAQLRAESAALTAQLAALRRSNLNLNSNLNSNEQLMTAAGGWRGAAVRQLERRRRAETLNRELKTRVREFKGAARQLERAWRLQQSLITPSSMLLQPELPVEIVEQDYKTVETMVGELDALYAQVDQVVAGCDRQTTLSRPCTWETRRWWDADQDREYVETIEARAVPFELQDAVAAV